MVDEDRSRLTEMTTEVVVTETDDATTAIEMTIAEMTDQVQALTEIQT